MDERKTAPATEQELATMDAYWRAANYLSACQLYLLDEPIGGVDPAARDYILNTILTNYSRDASVILSTHLIADVEQVLDEVIFLQNGRVERHTTVDAIRGETGKSVDELFREVFKC